MLKQFNITSQLTRQERNQRIETSQPQNSFKRWCTPSFRPSELHTKTKRRTSKMQESPQSEEGTECSKLSPSLQARLHPWKKT